MDSETETVEVPSLEGQEIKEVRKMNEEELEQEFGDLPVNGRRPTVIVTEAGNKIFPSKDTEGNWPGALFGSHEGKAYMVNSGGEA